MQRFTGLRLVVRGVFALIVLALLIFGFVAFVHGSDKEHLTNGVGVTEHWRSTNGLVQMVFGAFLIQFVLIAAIVIELGRLRHRVRDRHPQE